MLYDAPKAIAKARRRAEDASHEGKGDEDRTTKQSTTVKKEDISLSSGKASKDKGQGKKRRRQSVIGSDNEASESYQDDSSIKS